MSSVLQQLNKEALLYEMQTKGCCLIENVFGQEFIQRAKAELAIAIDKEAKYHKSKEHKDYAMVMLCSLYGGSFIKIFDNQLFTEAVNTVHGEGSIVYAYKKLIISY